MSSNIEPSNLVNLLQWRAIHQPNQCAYIFESESDDRTTQINYGQLDRQARAIATQLQSLKLSGKRALLLYPSGLEFIAAFLGCLYAGTIAVPCYPPRPNRSLLRLQAIQDNSKSQIVLTTSSVLSRIEGRLELAPNLSNLQWIATDRLELNDANPWQSVNIDSNTLAFLQYTSGSTGKPKGVMVSHGNLMHNSACIQKALEFTPDSVSVTWLPSFHDMGLICGILQPLYTGFPGVFLSPVVFLGQPIRWLQAISRHRATHCGGPNFGYELCIRKTKPEQRKSLDLSHWRVAYSGAEPICPETLKRFSEAFAPYGFRGESFYPCYGLAESTLMVSGSVVDAAPIQYCVQTAALERNRVVLGDPTAEKVTHLVGCGQAGQDTEIVIVDRKTQTRCKSDRIGEIWVSSPSVALGYWHRPHVTQHTFQAYLKDTGEGPFLRTGDLGFLLEGELFVTGRIKDLLILGGRNYYPQDLERAAQESHPGLRLNCGAAFTVTLNHEEKLVIVYELERSFLRSGNLEEVVRSIRRSISEQYEIIVDTVVLLKTGSIPKTSSGKIQRRECRSQFLAGTLEVIFSQTLTTDDCRLEPPLTSGQLADIEAKLRQHPHVADTVVRYTEEGTRSIAYIVPKPAQLPTLEELQIFWHQTLPDIRLPQTFIYLEKLPRTADGNIDDSALPNPLYSSATTNFVAPKTEIEKRLAVLWQQLLWIDRPISLRDNFFDLGGNSLQAARLIETIETEFQTKLPLEALSQLSTIEALIPVLTTESISTHNPTYSPQTPQLEPEYYRKLLMMTAGWQGQRISETGLMVGANTTGDQQPLFWCLQTYRELTQLAKYLGSQQPIYGMRSAHLVMDYTGENITALAAYYVAEILTVQPKGTYLLGGNCQGGAIAWEISRQLKQQGKTVQLLCLLDGFYQSSQSPHIAGMPHVNILFDRELSVPQPYDGAIALFFGRESSLNPYKLFREPELGWRKLYRQGYSINLIPGTHGEFFNEPNIQVFAHKLQTCLAASVLPETEVQGEFQQLPKTAYQAKITPSISIIQAMPGAKISLPVTIKNLSPVTWKSTEISAITLGNHWLDETQTYIQWSDGRTHLPQDLSPGEEIERILEVTIPHKSGSYQLELDLVEEGVTWFKDRGSKTAIVDVQVQSFSDRPKLVFPYRQLLECGPNIIGGTGGSGTRAIARIVRQGGMFIGTKLNQAEDAISLISPGLQKLMNSWQYPLPSPVYNEVLAELKIALDTHLTDLNKNSPQPWGWKLPPSIFFLPFLHHNFPHLKCLHLIRDGRDMAFSENQNQLTYLSQSVLTPQEQTWSQPLQSMQLWTRLNLACAEYGEQNLGDRYLRIRFEDLCEQPEPTIAQIFEFFQLTGNISEIAESEISKPSSIGRWREQESDVIAAVTEIGKVALKRFGYLEPVQVSESEKMFLREHFDFSQPLPQDPEEQRKLGDRQFERGDFESAVRFYQNAIAFGCQDAELYSRLGDSCFQQKQFEAAIASYRKALQDSPENPLLYFALGKAQHQLSDLEAAIANYKRAIELKFESGEIYRVLGQALVDSHDEESAIIAYHKAINIDPFQSEIYEILGNFHLKKEQLNKAIEFFKKVVEFQPERAGIYHQLGHIYLKVGNIDKAIIQYQLALSIDSQNPWFYGSFGKAFTLKGDLERAVDFYQKAIKRKSDHPEWYRALGDLYRQLNNLAQAATCYEKALEFHPQNSFVMYKNLGEVFSQDGKKEDAIVAYQNALKLKPDAQPIRRTLEKLSVQR